MLDSLGTLQRTHYCGNLRAADADKDVVLMGWVHRRRDLGNLIFIDLRDRSGLAQIVFNKELHAAAHARAEELRSEFVVAVIGRVVKRQKVNPDLTSGEVEIIASELRILNTAKTPPFVVEDELTANEETRLRYRYLDLRRTQPRQNLALRHRVILEIRKAMDEMGFYEIETPMLTRSTPEGARDYLVPSRVHPGQFYALPQSPQIFKQILMIGGMDRYFQIVKCFRDEDLRADRQPEFTQLDLEISFPTQDTVFGVIENVMVRACAVAGITVKGPFRRMEYKDAIRRYGSDKPDLRFGMELHDVTEHFAAARETLHIEGNVQAFAAPGAATFSRKQLDEIAEKAKSLGARGVYTVKVTAEGVDFAAGKKSWRGDAEENRRQRGSQARRSRRRRQREGTNSRHGCRRADRRAIAFAARGPVETDSRRTAGNFCGSPASRSSNGARRKKRSSARSIPSPGSWRKIFRNSRTPPTKCACPCARRDTTWC